MIGALYLSTFYRQDPPLFHTMRHFVLAVFSRCDTQEMKIHGLQCDPPDEDVRGYRFTLSFAMLVTPLICRLAHSPLFGMAAHDDAAMYLRVRRSRAWRATKTTCSA